MSTAKSRNTGSWLLALGATAQLITAANANAQATSTGVLSTPLPTTESTFTHIVEWDIPFAGDIEPGAVTVDTHGKDNNRIWFLTRTGAQKVYRFDPAKSLMKGAAQWTSWQLSLALPSDSTGGLKRLRPSDDRRYVFVRTASNLQRVDTQNCKAGTPTTCELTVWQDKGSDQFSTSDLAIDGMNRVFTTAIGDPTATNLFDTAYLQMLTPGAAPALGDTMATAKVKRWPVGGGAGFCVPTGAGGSCLSGVDVYQSKYQNLVYYSEPEGHNIGELNIVTNLVRRWSVTKVGASQPRQLNIDQAGIIWVVTGSGHVVSLDPNTNKMTGHRVPVPADSDLFGVAPDDDVIGYTNASLTENKVAMLFPKGDAVTVTPVCETLYPFYVDVPVMAELSVADSNSVPPQGKIAPVTITSKDDGVFVEAGIDKATCVSGPCSPVNSQSPRGITPNRGKAQGTFFYTVGLSADVTGNTVRIGFARLPHRAKIKHARDDDDCDEGVDAAANPGWHDHTAHPDDPDDDGVDSTFDTHTSREDSQTGDTTALGAGQIAEYPLTATPTTLALIVKVIADDTLAQMTVEIYNQLGALVASGVSVGGVTLATVPTPPAGAYKVRVKNYGLRSVNQTPTFLVRQPWLP